MFVLIQEWEIVQIDDEELSRCKALMTVPFYVIEVGKFWYNKDIRQQGCECFGEWDD